MAHALCYSMYNFKIHIFFLFTRKTSIYKMKWDEEKKTHAKTRKKYKKWIDAVLFDLSDDGYQINTQLYWKYCTIQQLEWIQYKFHRIM